MQPEGLIPFNVNPALMLILTHMNAVYTLPSYFFKIELNIILSSTLRYSGDLKYPGNKALLYMPEYYAVTASRDLFCYDPLVQDNI
jgi:hypothetical protein